MTMPMTGSSPIFPQQQQQPPSQPTRPDPTSGLMYLDLDFTAGIYSDLHSATGQRTAPDGAATNNSFACFSPASGGLAPLPAPASGGTFDSWSLTPKQITNNNNGTGAAITRPGYLPDPTNVDLAPRSGYGRMYLVDALVQSPVAGTTVGGFVEVPFAMFQYLYKPSGTGNSGYTPYTSFCRQFGPSLAPHCSIHAMDGSGTWLDLRVGPGSLQVSTSAVAGVHRVTVLALGVWSPGPNSTCIFYALPNPASPASTVPYSNDMTASGGLHPYWALVHQGSLCLICDDSQALSDFTPEGSALNADQIYRSAYGKFDLVPSNFSGPLITAEENPSGIGAFGLISANQIILVKNAGGGIEITGALDNPTVLRLPGIRAVGGFPNMACSVPGHNYRYPGIVYGTDSGVFMWAGLDNSDALSENLDPLFWISDRNGWLNIAAPSYNANGAVGVNCQSAANGIHGPLGRFGYHHPFLFAPNSYVLDMRSGAWWRLVDPATPVHYTHWSVSAVPNRMWGFKEYIDDANNLVAQCFDMHSGQAAYFYESQPLTPSRNRYIEVREILTTIIGNVNDTVTVTLVGIDNANHTAASQPEIITLARTGVNVVRVQTALVAAQVQVQIQSTNVTAGSAPRVKALAIGYKQQTQL